MPVHFFSTGTALIEVCSVIDTLRLADGTLFPIPVTLDVSQEDIDSRSIVPGARFTLRDPRDDEALAIFTGEYSPRLCHEHFLTAGQSMTSTGPTRSARLSRSSARTILHTRPLHTSATR